MAPKVLLALPPYTADWLAAEGDDYDNFGGDVNTAGDVNGDGYSDALLSCPGLNADLGAAFVYYGGPNGLPASPSWISHGVQAGRQYSNDSAPAGDVNGDGYGDIIVGCWGFDSFGASNTIEGQVSVFHGSPAGLSATADWQIEGEIEDLELGTTVSPAGDVNGDGYDDILVSGNEGGSDVRLHLGSASGLDPNYAWRLTGHGMILGAVGDINADGYDEITVSASGLNRVYLFFGSASGPSSSPDWTGVGASGTWYGRTVAAAGDVDGDGYADFAVGSPQWGSNDTGRVFLYYGGPSGVVYNVEFSPSIIPIGAEFGIDVQCAGDVNADGFSDLIVGAHYFNGAEPRQGRAYLYLGDPSGLLTEAVWVFDGDTSGGYLGRAVSGAGDINADGYSDLLVGAPSGSYDHFHEGVAYAFYSTGSGLTEDAFAIRVSGQEDADLGLIVAHAGDLNGDGLSDIVAGAPFYDGTHVDEGTLLVWDGTTSDGDIIDYSAQRYGAETTDYFGASADRAGDVNGDGYDDLLVSAVFRDGTYVDGGAALLYYGSETGIPSTPGWISEGESASSFHGYHLSGAGDVNGDGYADVLVGAMGYTNTFTNQGAAYLYYGSESGLSPTYAWKIEGGTESEFLGAVDGVGDLNGDGFSDFAVGVQRYTGNLTMEGAVFVYYGSASGPSTTPDWTLLGRQEEVGMWDAAEAGDVNGDGYGDLLIATAFYDHTSSQEGRVELFYGSPTGPSSSADWSKYGERENGGWLGRSVSTAGDVNRDGYADIVIGEEGYDGTYFFEGAIYIYHGGPTGLTLGSIHTSGQENPDYGASCSTAGDLNGDGFGDVIVGAPNYTHSLNHEGAMFAYLGNDQASKGGLDIRPQQKTIGGDPIALLGMSDSPSSFVLGTHGRSPSGRDHVRAEWQIAEVGESIGAQPVEIGSWQDTGAPDPNLGSVAMIEEDVFGLASETLYHWRVRTRTRSLYSPVTMWTSIAPTVGSMAQIRTSGVTVSVDESDGKRFADGFASVAPNPMTTRSTIAFQTRMPGLVTVSVHDVTGRRITRLLDGLHAPGSHETSWDGTDENGNSVPSGLYLLRIRTSHGVGTEKIWVAR